MKSEWEKVAIREVVAFQRGLTYSKNDEVDFSTNKVLRANNVNLITNKLDFSEMKYINSNISVPDTKKVKKGSLIICTASGSKSHLGKVALIDDDYDFAFGGFMGQITPHYYLNPKFLFYVLTSQRYKNFIAELSSGININNLTFETLGDYSFQLPPLPEQQRIVAILDQAFEAIETAKANTEKNLQNIRELINGYIEKVFSTLNDGWDENNLDWVCDKITDGTHITPKYVSGGIPFLSVKNVTQGSIDFTDTRFITEVEHKFLTKTNRPKKDDILYSKVGTTGVARVIDVDREFSIFVSLALLKIKHDIVYNRYLEYFLNSPFARAQAQSRTRGTANRNLVITDIKEIIVRYPKSLTEQRRIVGLIDKMTLETKKLESVYKQKLLEIDALKKSILQKAFNGEL